MNIENKVCVFVCDNRVSFYMKCAAASVVFVLLKTWKQSVYYNESVVFRKKQYVCVQFAIRHMLFILCGGHENTKKMGGVEKFASLCAVLSKGSFFKFL